MYDMNRRTFVAALVAGGLGATATVALARRGEPSVDSDSVVDVTFRRADPDDVDAEPTESEDGVREYRPAIRVDRDASTITASGRFLYGSSDCDQVGLERVTFDEDAGTLAVRLHGERRLSSYLQPGCDDVASEGGYELTVEFRDDLPARVTVTEQDLHDREFTSEWTNDA